jgi:ABC-2 type transport system ATP-binding protein
VAALHLQLADKKDITEAVRVVQSVLQVKALVSEPGLITAPMPDPERITDLLIHLRGANIRLAEVSVQEPTLDEVFLSLTGHTKQEEKGAAL